MLVDLLIKTVHRIGARAGRKVTKELTNAFKKVRGKENILFSIAEAAIDHPDDVVRTVLYPAVAGGEKTLKVPATRVHRLSVGRATREARS